MSRKKLIPALNRLNSFWVKNSAWVVVIGIAIFLSSCNNSSTDKLPILGQREAVTKVVNGKSETDSVYQSIPDFKFVSQYGDTVTARTLDNKIYVADFFFTSCPTICPLSLSRASWSTRPARKAFWGGIHGWGLGCGAPNPGSASCGLLPRNAPGMCACNRGS